VKRRRALTVLLTGPAALAGAWPAGGAEPRPGAEGPAGRRRPADQAGGSIAGADAAPGRDGAADVRRAVEAYVARLGGAQITDLTVRQTVTFYHPDGRHPQSTAEQRLYIKAPRRQRLEQVIEGQREVRLAVGDRTWVRRADGVVVEATAGDRSPTQLITPFRRTAADLLAEWAALGVRTDVAAPARFRGRPVTVIGARPGDLTVPAVWLDPEHGVVRVVTRERRGRGETVLDLVFDEHRPLLGGAFYPYRQELFADGRLLFVVIVREVAVNTGPADVLFDPDALRRGA
jgi:hypothetical protein